MVKFLGSALDIPAAITPTEAVQRRYVDSADGALSDRVGVLESGGSGPGGSALNFSAREVSGDTTALVGDFILADATAGVLTVTLPDNPTTNSCLGVKKVDDSLNHVIVRGQGGALIDGDMDLTLLVPLAGSVLIYEGLDWHVESTAYFDTGLNEWTYRGDWVTGVDYVFNDVVYYLGSSYIAKQNTNSVPPTQGVTDANWGLIAEGGDTGPAGGMTNQGDYSDTTGYFAQQVVQYNGSSYVAVADTQGNPPTDTAYWDLLAAPGPPGGSSTVFSYKISSTIVPPVLPGEAETDSTLAASATVVRMAYVDQSGGNLAPLLRTITTGDEILIQDKADASTYVTYKATAPAIDVSSGSYVEIPVAHVDGTLPSGSNKQLISIFVTRVGVPGPAGESYIWKGAYSAATNYAINDTVSYSGGSYIALAANGPGSSVVPPTAGGSSSTWSLMAAPGATGNTGSAGPGVASGGAVGQALVKKSTTDYDTAWQTLVPTGGSSGQVLAKTSGTDYVTGWSTINGIPAGGSSAQVLAKTSGTDYATGWSTVNGIPAGGTAGQVLAKVDATNYNATWTTPSASGGTSLVPTSVQTGPTVNASVGQLVLLNAANAITVNLPAAASGATLAVKRLDSANTAVTVVPAAGTIDGDANLTLVGLGSGATLIGDGTNWQIASTALVNSSADSLPGLIVPSYSVGQWFDRRSAMPVAGSLTSLVAGQNFATVNTCAYVPVYAHRAVNFDAIGFCVGTSGPTSGAALTLGIFTMKADGTPGTRVSPDWGAVALSTATQLAYLRLFAGTLPRGWSFWGIAYNATSPGSLIAITNICTVFPNIGLPAFNYASVLNTPSVPGYSEVISGGTIPNTANATIVNLSTTVTTVYTPNIWIRAAA